MSSIMDSLRKWFYKPRRDDTSHLAQFFYADEALNLVAAELDSFDGRKDPERCTTLVNHLRQCQDKVLTICNKIMDEMIPNERADRDFRVKFPDDVMQDNLAGQLWFGAECLAAGSSIMNRESESGAMRPLAKALTKSLENVRNLLREAAFRSQCAPPAQYDHQTEILVESLKMFDRLLADFELAYVSAMVPVKSVQEYELQQCVVVLFSETLQRALHRGLLTQEMVDQYDPALMFTIPRLAIVAGLLIYPHGPLSLTSPQSMSDMFRPFRTLLMKIRELLWTLTEAELMTLEKMLCSSEDPDHPSDSRISSEISNATKDDLDDSMICSKELSDEFDLMMDRKILSRHASDNSSIDSTLTCIERNLQVDDVNSINDNETSSMRRAIMPHLIFLNHMSDEDRSSLQGQDSGSIQNNSDDSLSDQTPEPSDLHKIEGPSTSSDTWTLHVIPCECSYARCSPNCNCATDKDVRWPKSDNTVRTIKCDTVSAQSDQPGCSQGICKHASPSIEQANNNLAGNNDFDDNSVNLNNNFSKEIVGKKLGNLCSSEVVVNGLVDRTSPVDQKWGETSHNLRGKYDENWENLSTLTSSNPQDIRKHTIGSESDASSFSSSCSSCQSTVSAISNSVSTDTSSYNSDCLDDLEVALAMKAAEVTNNKEARAKFRSSADLVHRLFVCISGVADQLQTNFAGDLRNILKAVFLIHASDRNDYETTDDPNNGECCERGEDAVVWGERDVESPPAWVPDQAAPTCMSCQLPFTVVRRRHHCRNCGKVFCARCSSNSVPLPRYGHLKPVRVCNRCFIYQVTPFTIDQNIATAN